MTYAEAMKRAIRELERSRDYREKDRAGCARVADAWVTIAREIRTGLTEASAEDFAALRHVDYPPVDM